MIAGLDSSYGTPSAQQALDANAHGVRIWSGYLATKPAQDVNLAHPWTQQDFNNARLCGSTPLAYCSGWDDPEACKALAAQWNVRLCLDVENGIRGDGPWVQGWLDASGAGLYGNSPVFSGRRAPFYVLAAYPGDDPRSTWAPDVGVPSGPHGWQWQGTHTEFGCQVDRGWYDDWFTQDTSTNGLDGGAMYTPRSSDFGYFFTENDGDHWTCKGTGKVVQYGIKGFYQKLSLDGNTLPILGLPQTNEIYTTVNGQQVAVQFFERGILAWDPHHVIGRQPGTDTVQLPFRDSFANLLKSE